MADDTKTDLTQTTVADLPGALEKITDVKELERLASVDDRVTAKSLYSERIAALQPAASAATAKGPANSTKTVARVAETRVKYHGKWYAPGDTVPFESADDAIPFDETGAIKPLKE